MQKIVLVGLPGAGKSTVGPLVAQQLGWRFVDLDLEIEREAGRSVAEIFADEGEAGFRARERAATERLATQAGLVLAPGGGWLLDPANRTLLGPSALLVYLKVSPATALTRMGGSVASRPLLAGPDPAVRLGNILAQRESLYMQANQTVSVDLLAPDEVAASIVVLASGETAD